MWTTDQVRAMQDPSRAWPRYELIGGELLVTPAPRRDHQAIVAELFLLLAPYVHAHQVGVAELSPADLELAPGEIVQPDLFVSPLVQGRRPREWRETKALLRVVEVLSPSTARHDRVTKRRHFAEKNVPEYWVVDLDARIVERTTPGEQRPEIITRTLRWLPDRAPEAFVLELPEFFARVLGEPQAGAAPHRTVP